MDREKEYFEQGAILCAHKMKKLPLKEFNKNLWFKNPIQVSFRMKSCIYSSTQSTAKAPITIY